MFCVLKNNFPSVPSSFIEIVSLEKVIKVDISKAIQEFKDWN